MKYKKGDKVVCIGVGSNKNITYGKTYTIIHDQLNHPYVRIINDNGADCAYSPGSFTIVRNDHSIGDMVTCISTKGRAAYLTIGKIYKVLAIHNDKELLVTHDKGLTFAYDPSLFARIEKYKTGDKVRCVNSESCYCITKGNEYDVVGVNKNGDTLEIGTDTPSETSYYQSSRFELVVVEDNSLINDINKYKSLLGKTVASNRGTSFILKESDISIQTNEKESRNRSAVVHKFFNKNGYCVTVKVPPYFSVPIEQIEEYVEPTKNLDLTNLNHAVAYKDTVIINGNVKLTFDDIIMIKRIMDEL